jgi:SAM-dependent methyltransferase
MMARMPVETAVLVDFSPPMLEAAERALAGSDVATSVVMGDLYDPQWVFGLPQPREFDVVMSRHAIHHLPDDRKVALYAEIFGLLRPGGVFVNIEHVKSRALPYQQAFDQVMIESIHALAPVEQSIDEVTAAYRTRMDGELNILADVWEQARWLERIGYMNVDIPFKALELAVFCGQRPGT